LQKIIDGSPIGDLTCLVTEYGMPFTVNGFGNWFRDRCNEAGLPHCSAHGLRKAGAKTAAENGATPHQLMSIFGWLTLKEAERYTQEAQRKLMAAAGMELLVGQRENKAG
jgi:site-specific recombinase XerD